MKVSAENTQEVSAQLLRILLVDDHDLVRQGLRSMLDTQPGWTICGEAATGLEAIELSQQLRPDVAVVDIHMPGMDGLQATREILAINPQIEVLILTLDETEEIVRGATAAGARGIVMKSDAAHELVTAVATLARHEPFYATKASKIIVQSMAHPLGASVDRAGLSKRERDVVILVAEGHSNKEIGAALSISAKTVESHRRNVMHKLGLKSTAELVRYAVRDGLIQP
ncbi:MAG TPA: response regulator transcription factor [Verrucomicrobiae bacterium]|nr:response regulator transcription factor [Verrucomicrobiae bacterium]